jgi:phosphopantothenoylcysteine decarboxylase/phosphopantothenate--cysteine ligase
MTQPLEGRKIVVGVAGGIAAYKAVELVRMLQGGGATVRVALTPAATSFVPPLTFQALTRHPVLVDVLSLAPDCSMDHIEWGYWADALVLAPATADLMSRLAAGRANDAVTTLGLTCRGPVVLAPAMEPRMWSHPATQHNVETLKARGAHVVAPGEGRLASGRSGVGRLADLERVVDAVRALLGPRDLCGRRVLCTAGPTHEPIDPVRFITNRSSGKMGLALAGAARDRGAAVTLVHGPVTAPLPAGVHLVGVTTAQEMLAALVALLPGADLLLMAAAVSDWRPENPSPEKRKKGGTSESLALVPNPDLLVATRDVNPRCVRVGFAAETSNVRAHAREKLARKGLAMIVANDVTEPGAGFGVDTNRVVCITRDKEEELPLMRKEEVAHAILDRVTWPAAG